MQQSHADSSTNPAGRPMQGWLAQNVVMPLIYGAMLFLAAGQLGWFWGWLFVGLLLAAKLGTLWLVRDPALIAERSQRHANDLAWDVRRVRAYGLLVIGMLIVAGLDRRFGWTPALPLWVHLIGVAGTVATAVLGIWAMRVNVFFSSFVRIQSDRHHQVVQTGPYRFVRHPGNLAMILWVVTQPLLLGTLWALVPALLATAVVIDRTYREDATLVRELDGYAAYTTRVRYRLLPAVW